MPMGQVNTVRSSAKPDAISSSNASGVETLGIDFVDDRDNQNIAQAAHLEPFAGCADPRP